jgi:hypothetical protein
VLLNILLGPICSPLPYKFSIPLCNGIGSLHNDEEVTLLLSHLNEFFVVEVNVPI